MHNCDDLLMAFVVANLTNTAPLLLQPTVPLRTISIREGEGDEDDNEDGPLAPVPELSEDTVKRSHCLAKFFHHFGQYAPDPSAPAHWPLKRSHSSVSQDLHDRSRRMEPGEAWEEPVAVETRTEEDPQEEEHDEDDGDDEDPDKEDVELDSQYHDEWEELLAGMSDDEVKELLAELADHGEDDQSDEDEPDEEDHHTMGHRGDEL